jgi:hypothetical protein
MGQSQSPLHLGGFKASFLSDCAFNTLHYKESPNHRDGLHWFATYMKFARKPIIPDPSHTYVVSWHFYARMHVYW